MQMLVKQIVFTLVLAGFSISAFSHNAGSHTDAPGIKFIENKGQWTDAARYKAEIPGGALFLTDDGFVYNFLGMDDLDAYHQAADQGVEYSGGFRGHAYKITFEGRTQAVRYQTEGKAEYYHNYFIGDDPAVWKSRVGLYAGVKQQNIYEGVDLHIYANGNERLKYDFIVRAGINPDIIRLSFDGVEPRIQKDGSLLIQTSVNEITESAPFSYQLVGGRKVPVASRYQYQDGVLSFVFPEGYHPDYDLIIDPDLIYATFSGGSSSAFYAHSTCYDFSGNTYTAALAYGAGWPTTTGAYQTAYPGANCVSVNKYSVDGSTLIYSTYFGGASNNVQPNTMRVTADNELVMAGNVTSPNMPTTSGAFQTSLQGTSDIYIAKFSADGSALLASTYVGGTGYESLLIGSTTNYTNLGVSSNAFSPTDIAFDAQGNIWVTSNSASTNFPVTTNAQQSTIGGSHDMVAFKMNPNLSTMLYGTYLGGNAWDGGIGIEYNAEFDEAVIVGFTQSSNFPTTSGAYITTQPGGEDGFVVKFDNTTYALTASTYLGTTADDKACRVAFDCAGNIFVAGTTEGNYPVTAPANSGLVPGGYIFIDKLSPTLTGSIASTRTGASSTQIVPSSLMVDICGNILIATIVGNSVQQGMPLTPDAFETNPRAFYFAAFEPNFNGLLFGSYYGSVSSGTSTTDHFHPGVCRMDPNGIVYHSVCASGASAANYPTTPNAFSPTKLNGTTNDNITFKFDFEATAVDLVGVTGSGGRDTIPHAVRGCLPAYFEFERGGDLSEAMILHYEISGSATRGVDFADIPDSLVFAPGVDTARLEIRPLLINGAGNPDPMEVIITVLSPCGCEDGSDNVIAVDTILIYDSLYVDITSSPVTVCANDEITISAEIDTTLDFAWQPAALIPDPLPLGLTIHPKPTQTTDYTITVTQRGAPSTCPPNSRTYRAEVEQYPQILMPSRDTTLCIMPGDSIDLAVLASPAGVDYDYQWSPADYLRDDYSGLNRFAAPPGDYMYHVNVSSPKAGCSAVDSIRIQVVPPFEIESVTPRDTTIKLGDRIQLHAEGAAHNWLWLPVTFLDDPVSPSPFTEPKEDIVYELIGMDEYGCRDTAEVKIRVEYASNTFIPSAFTPNGDGLNDYFNIANMKYERLLEFKVFNRYGQLVFESADGKTGWDGTINGEPAATDTYFYLIRVVVPFENEPRLFKGDITLLR